MDRGGRNVKQVQTPLRLALIRISPTRDAGRRRDRHSSFGQELKFWLFVDKAAVFTPMPTPDNGRPGERSPHGCRTVVESARVANRGTGDALAESAYDGLIARSSKMRRWGTFLFGAVIGGLLIYFVLNNHIIRAKDGLHLVPKVDAQLAGAYVDIRQFGPRDWINHPDLLAALSRDNQDELIQSATESTFDNVRDRILGPADDER
jgi:hypothetical protein